MARNREGSVSVLFTLTPVSSTGQARNPCTPLHKRPNYPTAQKEYPLVAGPDVMKGLMEEMGIGDDTLVVAYDNSGSLNSARFWWALNYYGRTNVKALNGGWKKWFDEGRPTSMDWPANVGEVTFTPKADDSLVRPLDYGVGQVANSGKFAAPLAMEGCVRRRWECREGLTYAALLPNGNLLGRTPLPADFEQTRELGGSGGSIAEAAPQRGSDA